MNKQNITLYLSKIFHHRYSSKYSSIQKELNIVNKKVNNFCIILLTTFKKLVITYC